MNRESYYRVEKFLKFLYLYIKIVNKGEVKISIVEEKEFNLKLEIDFIYEVYTFFLTPDELGITKLKKGEIISYGRYTLGNIHDIDRFLLTEPTKNIPPYFLPEPSSFRYLENNIYTLLFDPSYQVEGWEEAEVVGEEWGEKDKRFLETLSSMVYIKSVAPPFPTVKINNDIMIVSLGPAIVKNPDLQPPSFGLPWQEHYENSVARVRVIHRPRIYFVRDKYSDLLEKFEGKLDISEVDWYPIDSLGIVLGDDIAQGLKKAGITEIQGKLFTPKDNQNEWTKIQITKVK